MSMKLQIYKSRRIFFDTGLKGTLEYSIWASSACPDAIRKLGGGERGLARGGWCVYNAFSNSTSLEGRRKKEIMWWIGNRVEYDI